MQTRILDDLNGKVALVTGASSGIGLATARLFAQLGANVVLSARRLEVLNKEVEKLTTSGYKAIAVPVDVTNSKQVEEMVNQTVKHFGRLDYAVNCAGVIADPTPTHEITEESWNWVISVNLTSVWLCMKYELAQMVKQKYGAIVNFSSVAGIHSAPGLAAYNASKHGVVGLSKGTAVEYAPQGIRINALCPGWVETPMTAEVDRNIMKSSEPIGRAAKPEEIANSAVWLCSDAASFITGVALPIDGGMTT